MTNSLRISFVGCRPAHNQAGTSGVRRLQLQFVQKFPSTIFTGASIRAEDGSQIQIQLIDASSRTRVNSGPFSSIKVELVALKDDLRFDDEDDWTEQDFNASISREREGRRPLVTGDLIVSLREGAGDISEISFTDNSSWMRTKRFRLGARVVQKHFAERIREATSDPFRVKDRRGEVNQKHTHPLLDDEIWRLKSIRRDGAYHKKLMAAGIMTVGDFLRTCAINQCEVLKSLGRFSGKRLETIIQEAKTRYVDDGMRYTYNIYGDNCALQFNSIYQVVAATLDGHNYRSVEELTPLVKDWVEAAKKKAYKHLNDWIPVNHLSTVSLPRPPASLSDHPFSVSEIDSPVTHQDQVEALFCLNQYEPSIAQNSHPIMLGNGLVEESLHDLGDLPVLPSDYMAAYGNSLVQTPTCFPATWEHGNDVFFASDVDVFSRTGKPKAAWCKIRAAVKIMRVVASKRMVGY
ncbi:calmodulin-binding protein 60 B-like isoform X3 [Corylus avellana]|uniref:calmodulin-binding protein 60 B-like isoform X3 n=1 Tax=Corylus avellana TaxID=13451 RepID=UPI00286C9B0B|nr:calmodulin-binding protein 60 B-like isoform X3 [Corylus avellana]